MRYSLFSHCGGEEALPATEKSHIADALTNCRVVVAHRVATRIRDEVLRSLHSSGWSEEVMLDHDSGISITSSRGKIGLCLQTGNMSRIYADILKLQKLYVDGTIEVGAMVLPSAPAARSLGENIANADRLVRELEIFRKVIHLPVAIFAFE